MTRPDPVRYTYDPATDPHGPLKRNAVILAGRTYRTGGSSAPYHRGTNVVVKAQRYDVARGRWQCVVVVGGDLPHGRVVYRSAAQLYSAHRARGRS